MKNKYISFLIKAAALILVLLLIDITAGYVLGYYYPRMKAGESSRITYAIEKSNEDILIFGSSKANHHYVPAVFEKELEGTCYNAGIDGQNILYHYSILKCIQKRYIPKTIILDLHIDEFLKSEKSYSVLSALLPYYRNYEEVRTVVNMRGPYEKYKSLSNLYRYNSLTFTIAKNNIFEKKDTTIQGYYPLYNIMKNQSLQEELIKNPEVDTVKVEYFRKFINEAVTAGSKVYVFVSPVYRIRKDESETIKLAREICSSKNILIKDFSQSPEFINHPELFQDASHLNNNGAVSYSEKVSGEIKRVN